jgi:hypothetical protein
MREYYRLRVEAETRLRREQTVIDVQPMRVNLDTQGQTAGTSRTTSDATSAQTLSARQARARQTQSQGTSSPRTKSATQGTPARNSSKPSSIPAENTLLYAPKGKGQGISLENAPQTLGMIVDLTV